MGKGARQRKKNQQKQKQQKTELSEQINNFSGDMNRCLLKTLNSSFLPFVESNPHILCLGEI